MSNKNDIKKDDFLKDNNLNTEELKDVSGGILCRGAVGGIASDDADFFAAKADAVEAGGVQSNVVELAGLVGERLNRNTKKLNG